MNATGGNVVKLPRRNSERTLRPPALEELEIQLRSVEHAIRALSKRKKEILVTYRRILKSKGAAPTIIVLAVCLTCHSVLGSGVVFCHRREATIKADMTIEAGGPPRSSLRVITDRMVRAIIY
jgi:hypothetical protein